MKRQLLSVCGIAIVFMLTISPLAAQNNDQNTQNSGNKKSGATVKTHKKVVHHKKVVKNNNQNGNM
jgi:hypothetical protein